MLMPKHLNDIVLLNLISSQKCLMCMCHQSLSSP